MKKYLLLIILIAQCFIAKANTLYVEPDAGRAPVCQAISQAHQEIDIVMYLFTDEKLSECLIDANKRGVKVRVLLEKSPVAFADANDKIVQQWQGSNIQYRWVPNDNSSIHFFHEKLMLIDHQQAWIMTSNFTHSSFKNNPVERNFILVDNDAQQVKAAQILFENDWNVDSVAPNINLYGLVVSPLNMRAQLLKFIASAQSQINIYAAGMDDYQFIGELAKAADRGVQVKIIYSENLRSKVYKYFLKHHVQLIRLKSMQNHAKVIIVDNQRFYLGSANFTRNSFDNNRELGIVIDGSNLMPVLKEQFAKDAMASGLIH